MSPEGAAVPTSHELMTGHAALPDLTSASTEALRGELAQALHYTANHLLRLAAIWHELERRGEDLRDLRQGLAFYLPLIAAGKVDALLVSRFATKGLLLSLAAVLPMAQQRKLAQGARVPLCVWSPGGSEIDELERDPLTLTASQIRQVFGNDGIRPGEEQRTILQRRLGRRDPAPPVEFDPNLQIISVGGTQIAMRQISKAIARKAPPSGVPVGKRASVSIPDALHRSLRARAAAESKSVEELLIQVLWSAGIVEE